MKILRTARNSLRAKANQWRGLGFSEKTCSFDDLQRSVAGYGAPDIPAQVKSAIEAVKNGEAAHERDGVILDEIVYAWPVLAGVLLAAGENAGRLNLVDFGGSMGTTYFQNRKYLSRLSEVKWTIVEQESFVEVGRSTFATDSLHFESDLSEAVDRHNPHVALCSSSLQYIADPFSVLERITQSGAQHLIIDRTPFHSQLRDTLTLQTVSPEIYDAQYPAWIFSKEKFFTSLDTNWRVLSEFDSLEQPMLTHQGTSFFWQGAHFVRREDS